MNNEITKSRSIMDIHTCRRFNNLSEVRHLLDAGTDVNLKDKDGVTPLHVASVYGHLDLVTELIQRGADLNAKTTRFNWDKYSKINKGSTPLRLAIEYRKHDVVRELIKYGTDTSVRYEMGWTCLHLASCWNEVEMVEILINYCDPSIKDTDGKTALECTNNEEIKELIADAIRGPDIKEPVCY
jgi:ankyrin repeat protein